MFGEKENIGIFQSIELRATKHTHVADKNCSPKLLKPLVIFGDSQETPKIFMLKVLLFYVFCNVWRTGPARQTINPPGEMLRLWGSGDEFWVSLPLFPVWFLVLSTRKFISLSPCKIE